MLNFALVILKINSIIALNKSLSHISFKYKLYAKFLLSLGQSLTYNLNFKFGYFSINVSSKLLTLISISVKKIEITFIKLFFSIVRHTYYKYLLFFCLYK